MIKYLFLLMFLPLVGQATNNAIGIQVSADEFEFPEPEIRLNETDTRTEVGAINNTWAKLQTACVNPRSVNNQMPPTRIQIQCLTKKCQWEWVKDGEVDGTNVCMYGGKVTTSKRNVDVDPTYWGYKDEPTKVPCMTIEYVCYEVATPTPVTCDDIMKMKGVKPFCEDKIANFNIIDMGDRKVLKTKHTCPIIPHGPPRRRVSSCRGRKCL